eukprot:CAMPEP_0206459402 /NCGR_PEP_ID=MMETSP0324_2-20121206/24152_1 /ASSEMBLY_ACC=CAM_ASM_000836 /TAXON_ID=2866 /ORGANISM="Crypthecodinium cohnii, Strain Seligo" /LENGTH=309 /DNA_ID=CAMNT_0053930941 /DNA_START=80 /DNA_END=1009 /DNA_ORIENTATION=+
MTNIALQKQQQQRHSGQPSGAAAAAAAAAPTQPAEPPSQDQPLEDFTFRHFAPLLRACQGYAKLSGCRFRSSSFDPAKISTESDATKSRVKRESAATVEEYQRRLRQGDKLLLEEVDRAFRIVMQESVRNAMMGLFQTLDMFPPSPPPPGIDDDDCCYEDVEAPLPVVSQRLYNDQARRLGSDCGGPGFLQQRAKTAAFIVDFAEESEVKLPPIPETQQSMLREISTRVQEELKQRGESEARQKDIRSIFLRGLGGGATAESLRMEAEKFWGENWKSIALGVATVAALGILTVANGVATGQRRGRGSEL